MTRLYRVARCPKCHAFFIAEDSVKFVLCRKCNTRFKYDIGPKARTFIRPRHRWVARGGYVLMRAVYSALNAAGNELTHPQAVKIAQQMGAEVPGA